MEAGGKIVTQLPTIEPSYAPAAVDWVMSRVTGGCRRAGVSPSKFSESVRLATQIIARGMMLRASLQDPSRMPEPR
jgi:hypothetical protein